MIDATQLKNGSELYESFYSSIKKCDLIEYNYRHYNGDLFTCIKKTLKECKEAKEEWIYKKAGFEIKDIKEFNSLQDEISNYKANETALIEARKNNPHLNAFIDYYGEEGYNTQITTIQIFNKRCKFENIESIYILASDNKTILEFIKV